MAVAQLLLPPPMPPSSGVCLSMSHLKKSFLPATDTLHITLGACLENASRTDWFLRTVWAPCVCVQGETLRSWAFTANASRSDEIGWPTGALAEEIEPFDDEILAVERHFINIARQDILGCALQLGDIHGVAEAQSLHHGATHSVAGAASAAAPTLTRTGKNTHPEEKVS
jgi:hypothetical protein